MNDQEQLDTLAAWIECDAQAWDYIDEAWETLSSKLPEHLRRGPTALGEALIEALEDVKRACEEEKAQEEEDLWT